MGVKYAVIFWETENQYSTIKTVKIRYDKSVVLDLSALVGNCWDVEYEAGKYQRGKVIAIGSHARMSTLAANKAEEIGNLSFQEKEMDENYMKISKNDRKIFAKRQYDDDVIDNQRLASTSKKLKVDQRAHNSTRNSENVIQQMKTESGTGSKGPQCGNENLEENLNAEPTTTDSSNKFFVDFATIGNAFPPTSTTEVDFIDPGNAEASLILTSPVSDPTVSNFVFSLNNDGSIAVEGQDSNDNDLNENDQFEVESEASNDLYEQGNYQQSLEDKIQRLTTSLRKAKKEIVRLRKQLQTTNRQDPLEVQEKDIGNNILVNIDILTGIKSDYRHNPSKFLRAMMYTTKLFTLEEVANSSVTGQKSREGQRPRLDVNKFKAVKDYTIKVCKLQPGTISFKEFNDRTRDICSDARKAIKTKSRGNN